MNEVKITPVEIGDGVGFRGAVSISDEELKNRVDFLEQHTKEFSELVIKAENELYIRELLQRNENLKQELDQYKNNWEELKTYLNIAIGMTFNMNNDKLSEQKVDDYTNILNRMEKLEEDK